MGVGRAGSLAQVVNAALGQQAALRSHGAFFDGVGEGDTAGRLGSHPSPSRPTGAAAGEGR
jgi:hypothetical protein